MNLFPDQIVPVLEFFRNRFHAGEFRGAQALGPEKTRAKNFSGWDRKRFVPGPMEMKEALQFSVKDQVVELSPVSNF